MKQSAAASRCSSWAGSTMPASATVTTAAARRPRSARRRRASRPSRLRQHPRSRHDDPADRAAMQIRQHVALAERRDEQQLGVPAVGVAAEGGVGRAGDGRSPELDVVVRAVVAAVVGSFPDRGRPSRSRASRTCVCGPCRINCQTMSVMSTTYERLRSLVTSGEICAGHTSRGGAARLEARRQPADRARGAAAAREQRAGRLGRSQPARRADGRRRASQHAPDALGARRPARRAGSRSRARRRGRTRSAAPPGAARRRHRARHDPRRPHLGDPLEPRRSTRRSTSSRTVLSAPLRPIGCGSESSSRPSVSLAVPGRGDIVNREHRDLLAAIVAGDGERARRLAARHVRATLAAAQPAVPD